MDFKLLAFCSKAFAKKLNEVETIGDIQKYIDFYQAPEGQKFLDLMPANQTDLMKNGVPELQAKFKKKIEELSWVSGTGFQLTGVWYFCNGY